MKILVTVLLTALFVFALATAWVDYVQPQIDQTARASAEKAAPVAESPPPKKRVRKVSPPVDPDLLPVPGDDPLESSPAPTRIKPTEKDSADLLAQKMEEVKRQETSLAARQEALRMIYDDIRSELAAVDVIRKQASEDLAAAERRIFDTAQPSKPTRTAKAASPAPRVAGETSAVRADAMFIRHLVDQGKMETAISVLKAMKGRDAAGVLTYLSTLDSKLALQLADRVQAGDSGTIRR